MLHAHAVSAAPTLQSALQTQPAGGAAVAADAGGACGAGVQRYGPNHQRQRQRQVEAAGDVHVHLRAETGGGARLVRALLLLSASTSSRQCFHNRTPAGRT